MRWNDQRVLVVIVFMVLGTSLGVAAVIAVTRGNPADRSQAILSRETPRACKSVQSSVDLSGFPLILASMAPWKPNATLAEVNESFQGAFANAIVATEELQRHNPQDVDGCVRALLSKASAHLYQGQSKTAFETLEEARKTAEEYPDLAADWLYPIIFMQGLASLRQGEDENCVECRGEGACLFPLSSTAFHTKREGSERAVKLFTKYLDRFPDEPGAKWLLNLAYMTLGEHPANVPSQHLIDVAPLMSELDIGRFKDVSRQVGVNRFGMAGGAIMDDFDNDGLLDFVVTDWGAGAPMAIYRNKGDGTFEDRTKAAGLMDQLGGLNVSQTDYDNDGFLDLYVSRGAWFLRPIRPSLLHNNGNGTFTDVTEKADVMVPVNSNCAAWADYDNDGWLDYFVCNETGSNRLFHNRRDGTFEQVAVSAGVAAGRYTKGAVWLDYDRDGYPDLFVNNFMGAAQLYHNNRNGTFDDVSSEMGIGSLQAGFTCWAFDYDNDDWIDIFATCYARTLDDAVLDLQRKPTTKVNDRTRLFRNLEGKGFQDVSAEVGVDRVFVTMGANFADLDNDGFLDFYLGTGEPSLATILPNRMFKNVAGKRFAEITATAGVGHLQKGHGVAFGDWDRDGNVDMLTVIGGAIPGDQFHSALFQNPGHDNNWLTVKLVGTKTNRAAIGARIKVVVEGPSPLTVYRTVGSGSSFGGNPLEQTIGVAKGKKIARLEVSWPTSGTMQVFKDVAVNQSIEITEGAGDFKRLTQKRIPLPKE